MLYHKTSHRLLRLVIVLGRLEVLIVVFILVHFIFLNLLGGLLIVNALAARATATRDDVLGRDGLEAATLIVVVCVYN